MPRLLLDLEPGVGLGSRGVPRVLRELGTHLCIDETDPIGIERWCIVRMLVETTPRIERDEEEYGAGLDLVMSYDVGEMTGQNMSLVSSGGELLGGIGEGEETMSIVLRQQ